MTLLLKEKGSTPSEYWNKWALTGCPTAIQVRALIVRLTIDVNKRQVAQIDRSVDIAWLYVFLFYIEALIETLTNIQHDAGADVVKITTAPLYRSWRTSSGALVANPRQRGTIIGA